MKIVGLMPWFDESPTWLMAAVASAGRFVDHIVAVDGAYALFPGAAARSSNEQHEAVREAAFAAGVGLTIHAPSEPWAGNEVEKRNRMIELGRLVVDDDRDWFYVFDADTITAGDPDVLRFELERTDLDVASVTLFERFDLTEWPVARVVPMDSRAEMRDHRMLYRALPDLRVWRAHWCYVKGELDGDLRVLWGPPELGGLEPALELADVLEVEHRSRWRDTVRQQKARGYYQLRDTLGEESLAVPMVEGLDGELAPVRRGVSA